MKLSLWGRAKGRMTVILVIAFLNWAGFISWTLWVQVCLRALCDNAEMLICPTLALLSKLPWTYPGAHDDPLYTHVRHGLHL